MPASRETQLTELPLFRFLVLELVCVLLMVLDYHTRIGQPVRQALSALTYPLVQAVRLPQQLWETADLALSRQASLLKDNTELTVATGCPAAGKPAPAATDAHARTIALAHHRGLRHQH